MVSEVGEYKGSATITLKRDEEDKYGFCFGVKKAQLVLDHIDDIKKFVDESKTE